MVSSAEMERMMKVQEVILKAMAGKPEVVGSCRDHRGIRPDHAAVAGALSGARL